VNFSPDGQRLVSIHYPDNSLPMDSPHSIRVWDLATRKAIVSLNQLPYVRVVPPFSPDGRHFAACCMNLGVVKVWDAATGALAYTCSYAGGRVVFAVFSPDGKQLAACGENGVQIWDTATHRAVASWTSDSHFINFGLAYSPDGKRLAMGSIEGIVEVWDTQTGQKIHTFKGHAGNVGKLAFSPDGTRLVTGGSDGTLRWWDTTRQRDAVSIPKVDLIRENPELSPDGQTVTTGVKSGDGKSIRLWDAQTGQPRGDPIPLPERAIGDEWTADGKRLYVADMGRNIRVVDTATAKVVRTFQIEGDGKYFSFALAPNEKWYAHNAGPMGRSIKVRSVRTGAELRSLEGFDASVNGLLFSPDGSRLLGMDEDGAVKIWDIESGGEIAAAKFTGLFISGLSFSPDGKRVAVVGHHSRLRTVEARVLDTDNLREVWSLGGHTLSVTDAVFSPDGKRLATAGADRTIRLWDLTAGRELLKLSGFDGAVSLRFISNGRRLMSASVDRTIRVWDATPLSE
jgi:WD40 repeat protein